MRGDEPPWRAWLGLAEQAATEAGKYLAGTAGAPGAVAADLDRDVKLEADRLAEELILRVLTGGSEFPVLSEERGAVPGRCESALRWIVDPLDGSVNYLRGIPLCCVSVALWSGDDPLVGVVYDFNRGELFTAIAALGAWRNGVPIRVSETTDPSRAVLCTGFPASTDFSEDGVARFARDVRRYRKIRVFGSAALSLAHVATGQVDAYYERDIRLWDVAGGIALVAGAGGRIARAGSAVSNALTLYAGNAALSAPEL